MKFLEKLSDFVGKYMAAFVILIAALALFVPNSVSWIKTSYVNTLLGIVMFGMVAASGIKTLSRVNMNNRNLLIIAVAIGLGLGVTVRPDIIVNLPEGLKMLFSSGISTGTIAALILNITLKEEKVA